MNFVFLTNSVHQLFASLCELPDYHIHSSWFIEGRRSTTKIEKRRRNI